MKEVNKMELKFRALSQNESFARASVALVTKLTRTKAANKIFSSTIWYKRRRRKTI